MSFEEFQNQARLYVIGALEAEETEAFELARKDFGQKAEDYIAECYDMHEAFALSLRPAKSSDALKERLMAMVRKRQRLARCHALTLAHDPGKRLTRAAEQERKRSRLQIPSRAG